LRALNEQIYAYLITRFDANSAKVKQFLNRVHSHPELGTYVEFILFLYYTRSRSPIMMWNRRGERLKILEQKLPIDYRNAAISEIETQVMILLKESQGFGLLPWQVAVVKILYIGILVELKLRNRWSFWMNVFMIGSLLYDAVKSQQRT
jgi:hypothetical protein